jgi:hypothetical protein
MNAQKTEKSASTPQPTESRKPWIKKTPIEVFLDQVVKQEERVTEMRKTLAYEESELAKLQDARKVLERK